MQSVFEQASTSDEKVRAPTNDEAERYLGCSFKEYQHFIEEQFRESQNQLSWKNVTDWEIDHRKPLSDFDMNSEEGRKAGLHFSNTQPLHWAHHAIKTAAERRCRLRGQGNYYLFINRSH